MWVVIGERSQALGDALRVVVRSIYQRGGSTEIVAESGLQSWECTLYSGGLS